MDIYTTLVKQGLYLAGTKMNTLEIMIVWRFFRKLNIELPHDLAISFLGMYLKELKSNTQI
jgi:hypothetical protein